jgi:hypothetical protein
LGASHAYGRSQAKDSRKAKNKIKTDGRVIGSDMDQLWYIFARLYSNAQNMCLAFVRAEEEDKNGSGSQ